MQKYILSLEARKDLIEIIEHMQKDSPASAYRVSLNLRSDMLRIVDLPGIGHTRSDMADEKLSFWLAGRYWIVYVPNSKPIEIVRILHTSRDVSAVLNQIQTDED